MNCMTRHRHTLLLLATAFFLFSGCSSDEKPTASGRKTIAVIPKGTTHEFWKSIHAGAAKAAKELDVDIIWKGALREDSREEQIKLVEDFTNRGVSGIVLSPMDEMALRVPVSTAMRGGVPVVIFDSALKSDEIISFVATDNYYAGQVATRHLGKILNGKGRVIMLRYLEGSDSTSQREQAFIDTIKEFPGIEVVSANQFSGATTEGAYRSAENILAPLRRDDGSFNIDGIFCACEPTTFGMLRVLEDSNQAGRIPFVGFDATSKLVQALKDGKLSGLVMQDPVGMGYLGVKTMVEHLNGTSVQKRIDTGVTLATRENMDEPRVHELLYPEIARWLGENP
jgi:ribose transport system substrate-binding protein